MLKLQRRFKTLNDCTLFSSHNFCRFVSHSTSRSKTFYRSIVKTILELLANMMQFNTMDNFHSKLVSHLETKKSLLPTVTITAAAPLTPPSDSPPLDTTSEVGWSVDTPPRTESISSVTPDAIVAVIGVGYVGTHLVEAFARHYQVVAFDLSEKRLQAVAEDLKGLPIRFTSNASDINEATHILIAVPTVLKADKTIDTTYLRSAISTVEQYAKPGSTVVVESSVAVGMTRQLVGPLMASKNLKVGMSPEVCLFFTL